MPNSSQVTRSAVIAATVLTLGASPAVARQADTPAPAPAAVTTIAAPARHWTPARVESTGIRPADSPLAGAPAAAAPTTQATRGAAGLEWLLLPLAAFALALLLIVAVARAAWQRADMLRARRAHRV